MTVPEGFEDRARSCVDGLGIPCTVVPGGDSRQASLRAALGALRDGIEFVAVHDAARPFAPPALFASREALALAQTPQAFRLTALRAAHDRAAAAGLEVTDDAQALEAAGCLVRAIPGDPMNVKITTMLDLARAEARMGGGDA